MKFQKTLLAAALTLGVASAQAQQSSVTLFGLVDLGLQYASVSAPNLDSRSHLGMASGQSRPSVFGIKGVEALGNGNSVVFNLTSAFNASNGQTGESNQLFNQQATLGVRNESLGQVDFGRQTNMASKYFTSIDPFNTYFGQAGMGSSFGATNNTRYSNMVMLQSVSYNGFSAGVGYSFSAGLPAVYGNSGVVTDGSGAFGTTNNQRAITIGGKYAQGPVQVVATYDQVMPANNVGNGNASTPKQWIIGGAYDFNVVKASLAYGQVRGGWITGTQPVSGSGLNPSWSNGGVLFQDGFGANSYLVGLEAPMSERAKVFGSYQLAQPTGNLTNFGANQSVYSAGYSYDFSKRTTAYTYVSYAQNYLMVDGQKSTAFGVGMRHAF